MNPIQLRPSASERWLHCTAAPKLEAAQPHENSTFSEEGTLAHEVGELAWASSLGRIDNSEYERRSEKLRRRIADAGFDAGQMFSYATKWQNAVRSVHSEHWTDWLYTDIEVKIALDDLYPGMGGRGDFVGVFEDTFGPSMILSDLKYGIGVGVSPEMNPQQMLYAYGTYNALPEKIQADLDETTTIYVQIAQVRSETGVETWETTLGKLLEWIEGTVKPTIAEIHEGGTYNPGDWCQFCSAGGVCRARAEATADAIGVSPDQLSAEEIAEWLDRLPSIRGFCTALEKRAESDLFAGREIPGYGLKRSNGQRKIVDDELALERLVAGGFRQSDVSVRKLKPFGDLDYLVGGKDELAEILGDALGKSTGSLKVTKGAAPLVEATDEIFPPLEDEDWLQ